jgi:hypothetical protein
LAAGHEFHAAVFFINICERDPSRQRRVAVETLPITLILMPTNIAGHATFRRLVEKLIMPEAYALYAGKLRSNFANSHIEHQPGHGRVRPIGIVNLHELGSVAGLRIAAQRRPPSFVFTSNDFAMMRAEFFQIIVGKKLGTKPVTIFLVKGNVVYSGKIEDVHKFSPMTELHNSA